MFKARQPTLNYMEKCACIDYNVDSSTPFNCITPIHYFNHVELREELLISIPKHSSHPELHRKLALEVVNDIPYQILIIYTDSSRLDSGREGSGLFNTTPGSDVKISTRNSDHCCSVLKSELYAIRGAFDHALNSNKDSIWILTNSRSSIQYLKNWPKIMDNTGLGIKSKFAVLVQRKQVCTYRRMWVCLGTRQLMNLLVEVVISLTPVPLA
ncbi:RNase H domain-containing protein [Trichonephila clavipes]|nr:RNase H domain-containing protein [Trichonephila clavipes]